MQNFVVSTEEIVQSSIESLIRQGVTFRCTPVTCIPENYVKVKYTYAEDCVITPSGITVSISRSCTLEKLSDAVKSVFVEIEKARSVVRVNRMLDNLNLVEQSVDVWNT